MFIIIIKKSSQEAPPDTNGMTRACVNLGFFDTLDEARRTLEKIKSYVDPGEEVTFSICQIIDQINYTKT